MATSRSNQYKRAALLPVVLEMLRDGYQPRDIVTRCNDLYGVSDKTVRRAISTVRRELAEDHHEDRQIAFSLLKAGYERDLAEVDLMSENPDTKTMEYVIPKASTRIELRRKIRQSLADLYGFGKINAPSITINVAQLLPDQRSAQLWGRRDAIEGVVEAEYQPIGGDATEGNLDVVGGD
ncbi:MAG: hypothetical protein WC455_30275 [Dehalococcoidia bacterium]